MPDDHDPVPPPRRARWRRLGLAAAPSAVAAVVGLAWLADRPERLSDEEQRFVGWWRSPRTGPPPGSASPVWVTAVEYRADRTVRRRRENSKTGEVSYEVPDELWRAAGGDLVKSFPRPNGDVVGSLRWGEFRLRHEYVYRVTWDGPDRYDMQRTNLPPGVTWPVWSQARVPRPADAP